MSDANYRAVIGLELPNGDTPMTEFEREALAELRAIRSLLEKQQPGYETKELKSKDKGDIKPMTDEEAREFEKEFAKYFKTK